MCKHLSQTLEQCMCVTRIKMCEICTECVHQKNVRATSECVYTVTSPCRNSSFSTSCRNAALAIQCGSVSLDVFGSGVRSSRDQELILLLSPGNVNLSHIHPDVDCWHYSLLAVHTGRSSPRQSSKHVNVLSLPPVFVRAMLNCSRLEHAALVSNNGFASDGAISQEHSITPESTKFGHPGTHSGSPEVHPPNSKPINLDCFPRSSSNGIFPSRPTSYRLTTVRVRQVSVCTLPSYTM